MASHSALLRNLGVSQAVIDHMDDVAAREQFGPREQAVLRLAEQVTHDAKRLSDAQWNELCQYFEPAEIMELVAVAGLFAFFNRFNDALQVEITQPGWPGNQG
jgi:alkylhydroperoxidase family enzyme